MFFPCLTEDLSLMCVMKMQIDQTNSLKDRNYIKKNH